MAFIASEIASYKVIRYGNSDRNLDAFIHCYDASENNVASLVFWRDGAPLPQNHHIAGMRVELYYPTSAFAEILAILQNEKPLFFGFIESTKVGYLATTSEPVGEQEG